MRKWATGLLYTKTKALFIYLRDLSFIFRDKIVKSFFMKKGLENVSVNKEKRKGEKRVGFDRLGRE